MIAQVVFDLPIEGPFDYLVPEGLSSISVGHRVKVSFGPRTMVGFVVGLLSQSGFSKIKSIKALKDQQPVFNGADLRFAQEFSAYYGCTLGEALATLLRHKDLARPSVCRGKEPLLSLHQCGPHQYAAKIQAISHPEASKVLILVPDMFRAQALSKDLPGLHLGTRSMVFDADGRLDRVIMIDEEDASYKQEQSPMYETRQVLLMRAKIYGFDVHFVGCCPSVELMDLVRKGEMSFPHAFIDDPDPKVTAVDLSHYKFLPGLLSPPLRDAVDKALANKAKVLLVLNRRGSYRITRCTDCGTILKCNRCDSPLTYSRSAKQFLCRYCTYTAPGNTVCPSCHKPGWRSTGMGVEQLQAELKKYFPLANIIHFERKDRVTAGPSSSVIARSEVTKQSLKNCDILIATRAVLRFQGQWTASVAALIDFDAELSRMDMRSSFKAWSLARHLSAMCARLFIQTRNPDHYVIRSLISQDIGRFYDEELRLRKELGFSPFKHWIQISFRAKTEKASRQAGQDAYEMLIKAAGGMQVTAPIPDGVAQKRSQFRFHFMVQTDEVPPAIRLIKAALAKTRRSRIITTLNVDS